jgi:hypothetical protein
MDLFNERGLVLTFISSSPLKLDELKPASELLTDRSIELFEGPPKGDRLERLKESSDLLLSPCAATEGSMQCMINILSKM